MKFWLCKVLYLLDYVPKWSLPEPKLDFLQLSILLSLLILLINYVFVSSARYDKTLPIANQNFSLEPRVLALIRWSFKARTILDSAYQNVSFIQDSTLDLLKKISLMAVYIKLREETWIWWLFRQDSFLNSTYFLNV